MPRISSFHRETKSKVYYADNGLGVKKKKLLPEKYKVIFAQRNMTCIVYSGLADEQIRDMFQVSLLSIHHFDI